MSIEAMKQALEDFKLIAAQDQGCGGNVTEAEAFRSAKSIAYTAITALRLAIEQAEKQEPLFLLHTGEIDSSGEQDEWDIEADSGKRVDEFCADNPGQTVPLYTAPPQRQPLTEEDIAEIMDYGQYGGRVPEYAKNFVRAIERKHGIGDEK